MLSFGDTVTRNSQRDVRVRPTATGVTPFPRSVIYDRRMSKSAAINLDPRPLASAAAVAETLEISRNAALALLAAEVAGPTYKSTTDLLIDPEGLRRLELRKNDWADTSVPALNARVLPGFWSEEEERFIGWHARLPNELLAESIGGYWNVRLSDNLIGAGFVATISGWVVHVAQITGVRKQYGKRIFELGPPTPEQVAAYANRRIPTTTGGHPILRLALD